MRTRRRDARFRLSRILQIITHFSDYHAYFIQSHILPIGKQLYKCWDSRFIYLPSAFETSISITKAYHKAIIIIKILQYLRSSHNGPSLVAHWKPWMMESFTVFNKLLSTSEGRVSSTRILGPELSGPNAQIERAASKSQSYLVWKNSPSFFLFKDRTKPH